ncbi:MULTISPECIES: DUF6542 domain-containing protein [Amycolatopsis]|uniref:DUF6542 domain-containing protein n=1 Tax=Amycolatopsis dongchuanensis TaxID=1070866 RepID=A0ABP9Q2K2_9PSEU|nr:DUF6542 domain-containing protein [Amycolatopsis sacchari]
MTAIRDRQSDTDADEVAVPWDARPVVGERRGLPWWGAVLLAFGLALVGAIADMQLQNALGWVFNLCYVVGAVVAICAVQRRSLFGPMVQPPLILAITVPLVVLLITGVPANSDTLAKALAVGTPLINGFPVMAITTGLTLVIGIFRLYRERNPEAAAKGADGTSDPDKKRPARQGRPRAGAADRPGKSARDAAVAEDAAERGAGATRLRRPADGRGAAGRPVAGDPHPSLPLTPRRRPEDPPRRGEGGARGDRRERGGEPGARGKSPQGRQGRVPRGARDDSERRRGAPRDEGDRRRGASPDEGDRRRGASPDDADRRRGGEGRGVPGDRPRRLPPRGGSSRGGAGEPPRRAPGRRSGPPPRGRRPWDEDEA